MDENEILEPKAKKATAGDKLMEKRAKLTEQSTESGKIVKKALITIDIKDKEVLSLDEEGYVLSFESTPGQFKRLSDKTLGTLGRDNHDRYLVSEGLHAREKYQRDNPDVMSSGVSVTGTFATATERLKVEGKEPGKWYAWKRPNELPTLARQGYKIARGESLRTYMAQGDEIHRVGEYGKDELILTEIPEELHQQRRSIVGEKSRKRIEAIETNAVEELRKVGGVPYKPTEKSGPNNWS